MEYKQFLKQCSGVRQAVTNVLNGTNLYWDEDQWYIAKDLNDKGMPIKEEIVDNILSAIQYK